MLLIVFCAVLVSYANGANILAVFPTPSYSHQQMFQPIWKELALKGHQVTVITPNPLNDPSINNLKEIDVSDSYAVWNKYGVATLGAKQHSTKDEIKVISEAYFAISEHQLNNAEVQSLIANNSSQKFDLLLVEFLFPIFYAFKDIYNCPMIGLNSFGLTGPAMEFIGNPQHPALHPEFILPFSSNLSLLERVQSTLFSLIYKTGAKFKTYPDIHKVGKKWFGENVRRMDDIAREVSLVIVNSNSLQNVKPLVPAYIEISGIHLKPKVELPVDLKKYLDDAKEGVIYFSLGSNIKSELLPKDRLEEFMSAFKELPYKILWKFENELLENKPSNVAIRKWLPQQDLLGHPNIKLFITQGGIQSIDESISNGVPLLAIPFFGDQRYNSHRLQEVGAGLSINFHTFTKEELKKNIIEIISNPKYKTTVKKLAAIAADQPMPAVDKAVWWIEYVLRHDGAHHLRYPAMDMPFYQYFLLDVMAFLLVTVYIVCVCLKFTIKRLYKKVFKSHAHEHTD